MVSTWESPWVLQTLQVVLILISAVTQVQNIQITTSSVFAIGILFHLVMNTNG